MADSLAVRRAIVERTLKQANEIIEATWDIARYRLYRANDAYSIEVSTHVPETDDPFTVQKEYGGLSLREVELVSRVILDTVRYMA